MWQPALATFVATVLLIIFSWAPAALARDGETCAFVTIVLSEDFVECTAVLVHSIRTTGSVYDVVVMVLPLVTVAGRDRLRQAGADHVIEVDEVSNPNPVVLYRSFSKNYSILRIWQVGALVGRRYGRAVYMDGDMLVVGNSDELCQWPELSAARDLGAPGARDKHGDSFNAGMMVFSPSEETFARLVDLAPHVGSPSGGVQPLLRAAFPSWTKLDHFRDNVNAHIFEHQHSAWRLSYIRSIHYTGPVKPCFTDVEDFLTKPHDEPFRLWHAFHEHFDGGSTMPTVCDGNCSVPSTAREADLWKTLFAVPEGSILSTGFGLGEAELAGVPAYHVCKHGGLVMGETAERVSRAGFEQLQDCLRGSGGGGCSGVREVAAKISRAVRWMHRTLRLFLRRSSVDAQVDVAGMGSVEAVLASHADASAEEARASLRAILAEAFAPHNAVFDIAVALARRIRRQEQLLRWHLTYSLLGLLWWQYRELRAGGHGVPVPASFGLELPRIEFQGVCCRAPDVFGHLLASGDVPRDAAIVVVGDPPFSEEVAEFLHSSQSDKAIYNVMHAPQLMLSTPPATSAQLAHRVRLSEGQLSIAEAPEALGTAAIGFVLLACPSRGDPPPDAELQLRQTSADLAYWSGVLGPGPGALTGCGFTRRFPGIVEAVSRHALERRSGLVTLATDTTWWLTTDAGGGKQ